MNIPQIINFVDSRQRQTHIMKLLTNLKQAQIKNPSSIPHLAEELLSNVIDGSTPFEKKLRDVILPFFTCINSNEAQKENNPTIFFPEIIHSPRGIDCSPNHQSLNSFPNSQKEVEKKKEAPPKVKFDFIEIKRKRIPFSEAEEKLLKESRNKKIRYSFLSTIWEQETGIVRSPTQLREHFCKVQHPAGTCTQGNWSNLEITCLKKVVEKIGTKSKNQIRALLKSEYGVLRSQPAITYKINQLKLR